MIGCLQRRASAAAAAAAAAGARPAPSTPSPCPQLCTSSTPAPKPLHPTATAAATHALASLASPDRISISHRLVSQPPPPDTPPPHAPPRSPKPPIPEAPPLTPVQLEALVAAVSGAARCTVLTGAGCSTESNIPDYRGPGGAYTTGFKPMTHQQFMAAPEARSRYWLRSFLGWPGFARRRPNAAHEGLVRLQQRGWLQGLITQNVDRLHQAAGSSGVLELHGTTHQVRCTSCRGLSCRHAFQSTLAQLNQATAERAAAMELEEGRQAAAVCRSRGPGPAASSSMSQRWQEALRRVGSADDTKAAMAAAGAEAQLEVPVVRPDGDVEFQDAGLAFVVPPCGACGGILKPDVVFFGDNIPKATSARALSLASECDLLLVIGSSLMVYSAFRLAEAAKKAGARVVAINVGPTRADHLLDAKYEVLAGEAAMKLATHPTLLLPRVQGSGSRV